MIDKFRLLLVLLILGLLAGTSNAQDPTAKLKEETLAYFKPLKGKVVAVQGGLITSDLGAKSGIRKGMRFIIFREGTPFLHPVTKEPMGKVEAPAGKAEVSDVKDEGSTMKIINGDAKEGDILRISEMKKRILFFQDKGVDWNLADQYYQSLKESGRFELLDASFDSGDDAKIIAEAKRLNTEVVIILTSKEFEKEMLLNQRMLWTGDSSRLADSEIRVDRNLVNELGGRSMSGPLTSAGDVLLFFDLPFNARLIAAGDLRGDGNRELIISTGRDLQVYTIGGSLQNLYEFKGSASDDFLWLDTMDINGDGRDEIIVTSMNDGEIVSYIYQLKGSEISLLWKDKLFLRAVPSLGIIAQKYDNADGFNGSVFSIKYNSGEFRTGDPIKLPKNVNIYDFIYITVPDGTRNILAYDDSGYLNLYNENGLRVWRSKDDYGGFQKTYKRAAPTVMVERGEWAVKDKLFLRNRGAFVVKRIPLANMAKGLGYKSSQIKIVWWTGLSMEENNLLDDISGGIIDYALAGDKLFVLSKPLFGLKPKNILKGENPLGSSIYVYSLKGR